MISKGSFKLTYAAGVLTLSVKGILKMDFPSATTTGDVYTADLTGKSWTFQDAAHASPQILGRLGTTASVAWGSGGTTTSMPLFIKLVNKDNTASGIKPCLTRDPVAAVSPASTNNIGILGTAATSSAQTNIILGYNDNTGYNSKPMVLIGACEGTIDNSAGGSMTIGATAGRFGCNPTALDGCFATTWTFPAGQNGNKASYYWVSASAKEPTYATPANIKAYYTLNRFGETNYLLHTSDAGNCVQNGSPAGEPLTFNLPIPIANDGNLTAACFAGGTRVVLSGSNYIGYFQETGAAVNLRALNADAGVTIQDDNLGDATSDDIWLNIIYKAF